jgi:hypothetical protein
MGISIAINADPDQNYPLCGSELSSVYTTDQETMQRRLFPLRFCLDKKTDCSCNLIIKSGQNSPKAQQETE